MSNLLVLLYPFAYPVLVIGNFFAEKKNREWLDTELVRLGVKDTVYSMDQIELTQYTRTSFGYYDNWVIYIGTLFIQALIFMFVAYIISLLVYRKGNVLSTRKRRFSIFLSFILGHIVAMIIAGVGTYLICQGFYPTAVRHPDFDMLYSLFHVLISKTLLSGVGSPYRLYGIIGILIEVYTLYVTRAMLLRKNV